MVITSPILFLFIKRFLLVSGNWVYFIIGGVIILAVVLGIALLHHKKPIAKTEPPMEAQIMNELIQNLGEISNIEEASQEGARLNIKVFDLKLCQLETIKKLGALGIFVSGKTIKFILPYDTKPLINRINKEIEER